MPKEDDNVKQPEEAAVEKKEVKSFSLLESKETDVMNPEAYMQMKTLGRDFLNSKVIPKHYESIEQVVVAIQAGREMGMQPMESVQAFYFVNGQLNIWGKNVTRRLREHGFRMQYIDEENKCTITVSRPTTQEEYTDTVTFEEAAKSGYTKDKYGKLKVGWTEGMNRRIKLRYMALNLVLKTYLAEVLGNANGLAEIDGEVIESSVSTSFEEDKPATENQKSQIEMLCQNKGVEFEIPEEMTANQATEKINELIALKGGKK